MNLTLHNLPIISKILNKLDLVAKNEGLVAVMRTIMARTGNKLIVKNKTEEIKKIMTKEPVLVICNHPAHSDVPILLSTLEPRKDLYLVASHHFINILPNADKQIIPVYVSHKEMIKNNWKFRLINKLNPVKIYDQETAHQKNIDSISQATKKINSGGLVVIFPAAHSTNNQFMTGVGYLIKKLQKPQNIKIVMAHTQGTSGWDYFRLIPFVNKFMPPITISFTNGGKVSEYINDDPKKTTQNLQQKYYRWVEIIE